MPESKTAQRVIAGGVLVVMLFVNSFIKLMQHRQPSNPYYVFLRDSAFFECAALLTILVAGVIIWYRHEMLKPEAKGDSFYKILFAGVFVVLVALMAGYTYWKTDLFWTSARECRCGDSAALFQSREEYIASSAIREGLPVAVLLVSTAIYPAAGAAASVVIFLFMVFSLVTAPGGGSAHMSFKGFFWMYEALLSMIFFFFNMMTFSPPSEQPPEKNKNSGS